MSCPKTKEKEIIRLDQIVYNDEPQTVLTHTSEFSAIELPVIQQELIPTAS